MSCRILLNYSFIKSLYFIFKLKLLPKIYGIINYFLNPFHPSRNTNAIKILHIILSGKSESKDTKTTYFSKYFQMK